MVAKKRKSKRQSLQQKYKIIKRCKDHKKKLKKGAVINGGSMRKKQNRLENRIPNAWPYKEDLLKEIQVAKERMEEAKQRLKEKRREEGVKKKGSLAERMLGKKKRDDGDDDEDDDEMDEDDDEEGGDEDGEEGEDGDEMEEEDDEEGDDDDNDDADDQDDEDQHDDSYQQHQPSLGQNSRRAYLGKLREVIRKADILLHVLDARDPMGTRSVNIERMISTEAKKGKGLKEKRMVYVLNKADLVPKNILIDWLNYLRPMHPTIAVKCNTQAQNDALSQLPGKILEIHSDLLTKTQAAVGFEELLQLLKNYARIEHEKKGGKKSSISVGIVGFPNVGKSSLINSMARSKKASVSSTAGQTKALKEVILDGNITLLDSPGVVFEAIGDGKETTTLRNAVNVEQGGDVIIEAVATILTKLPSAYFMQLYNIQAYPENNVDKFLGLVARQKGKILSGAVPNVVEAAKIVLNDWNTGKIKYYTTAPPSAAATTSSSSGDSAKQSEEGGDSTLKGEAKLLTELSPGLDWYKK